jgi:prophage tail gpP-like protein
MSGPDVDFAAIEVDDAFLDAWTEYSFSSDIFTPADGFSLSIGVGSSSSKALRKNLDYLRERLYPGAVVKLWVGHGDRKALQATGIIDARDIQNDGEGTRFSIEGRDFASYLVDSAAPVSLYQDAGTSLFSLARTAAEPWGISVTADADSLRDVRTGKAQSRSANDLRAKAEQYGIAPARLSKSVLAAIDAGTIDVSAIASTTAALSSGAGLSPLEIAQLKISEARTQAGETVWEFLDRHARRLGLLMRMGPDGTLNFTGLNYGQVPSYRLERSIDSVTTGTQFASLGVRGNNILSGGERYDGSRMYREVKVFGRTKSGDLARAAVTATARDAGDDAIPHEKTLFVHDDSIRSETEASKRAYRELAKSRMGAQVLEYTVRGHGQGGVIYAVDTVAMVKDEVCGISGPFYVVSRSFTRGGDGPRTTLRLVPLYSIVVG